MNIYLVDCVWDDWETSECSKDCGGGIKFKTRVPEKDAAFGGRECTGLSNITESCNIQKCPGTIILYEILNQKLEWKSPNS